MKNQKNLLVKIHNNELRTSDINELSNLEVSELFAVLAWKKDSSKDLDLKFKYHFLISKIYSYLQIKKELMTKTDKEIQKELSKTNQKIKEIMLIKITQESSDFSLLLDDTIGYYN